MTCSMYVVFQEIINSFSTGHPFPLGDRIHFSQPGLIMKTKSNLFEWFLVTDALNDDFIRNNYANYVKPTYLLNF